jgi:hypothetical protein
VQTLLLAADVADEGRRGLPRARAKYRQGNVDELAKLLRKTFQTLASSAITHFGLRIAEGSVSEEHIL